MNKGVYIALISIGLAQALKIPIHFFKTRKWKPSLFFQTGGMPSSHSAGVSSLSTFIALRKRNPHNRLCAFSRLWFDCHV